MSEKLLEVDVLSRHSSGRRPRTYRGLLFIATLVTAGGSTTADADSATAAPPQVLQVGSNGTFRFKLVGAVPLCSNVAVGDNTWGDVQMTQGGVTADGYKGIVSLLTAAKLAGRPVKIYASNGGTTQFGCLVTGVEMP